MTAADFENRNKRIFAMYQSGMTFAAIGRRMNLSRERIRQIVRQIEAN